ncbi:MAG: hypothetical protein GX446_10615 [Chthonomonadales bacterium]|nr:hypothetical protein [Chthonomonadales bacterium]
MDMDNEARGTGSLTPYKEPVCRREFLRTSAVKAALGALFGGAALDAVAAQVAARVEEKRALRGAGAAAADGLSGLLPQALICPNGKECSSELGYSCTSFTCGPGDFDCNLKFTCRTSFTCSAGSGHDYCCLDVVDCQATFRCTGTYECRGGGY